MSNPPLDKRYEAHREDHKAAFQLSGEYAKWFISTLLLLNSGAILTIFQKGGFSCAALIHGIGILLALCAAFAGWQNLQWVSRHLREEAENVLAGKEPTPTPDKIKHARYVGVALALASAIFWTVGAFLIWQQWPVTAARLAASTSQHDNYRTFAEPLKPGLRVSFE